MPYTHSSPQTASAIFSHARRSHVLSVCHQRGGSTNTTSAGINSVCASIIFFRSFILSRAKKIWPSVVAIRKCSKWCKIDDMPIFCVVFGVISFHKIIFFTLLHNHLARVCSTAQCTEAHWMPEWFALGLDWRPSFFLSLSRNSSSIALLLPLFLSIPPLTLSRSHYRPYEDQANQYVRTIKS